MKTFTNHTAGPRGILMTDGTTTWVDPGQSVEIDSKLVNVDKLPDLGKARKDGSDDDAQLAAAFEADNAALQQQVADLTKERDDHKKAADDATKQVADLTAALEKAKKPAA